MTAALVSVVVLGAAQPVAAGTGEDSACATTLLITTNCGDLSVSAVLEDCYEQITEFHCTATASATGEATKWINPDEMTVSVNVQGRCDASASTSWTLGGDSRTVSCPYWQVAVPRGQCRTVAAVGEATFTGTPAPRPLKATATATFCAPLPQGPAIVLYDDWFFEGCKRTYYSAAEVRDFSDYDFSGCPAYRMNDRISSLKVRIDCEVTLYEHRDFGGLAQTYWPGEHPYVGPHFNDKASSMKSKCIY